MEDVRDCPICMEVPEREIYQCSEGHIICSVCIIKLTECPQCRIKYGAERIRSRVLEELLSAHMFECKFKEKGCDLLCERSNLSSHASSCEFNPELVPLCEFLGWEQCNFRFNVGGDSKLTRSEIISHFSKVHKKTYHHGSHLIISGKSIQTFILNSLPGQEKCGGCLYSIESNTNEETSPLFFVAFKVNTQTEFLTLNCVHVWGTETKKYKIDFAFVRALQSSPTSIITTDMLPNGSQKRDVNQIQRS